MSFTINPNMDFDEVVSYYRKYVTAAKEKGITPVSFMRFITGRL